MGKRHTVVLLVIFCGEHVLRACVKCGNSALFCGGAAGCKAAIKGNGLFYGEALAGVAILF